MKAQEEAFMPHHPSHVAIIANTGLGDALWMMVIAQNFARQGHRVVLYNDFLIHLQPLFPWVTVNKYPAEIAPLFALFDKIIIQQHAPGSKMSEYPAHVELIYKKDLALDKTFALNMHEVSKSLLSPAPCSMDIGLQIPVNWLFRAYSRRVVIHPLSANAWKNWPAAKFIALAKKLQQDGFSPQFILPPIELAEWKARLQTEGLNKPLALDWMNLTQFIYESGYYIGNDASTGHLASSLWIPTLSIFDRKSRSLLLKPSWGPNLIIRPPAILFGRALIKALWKRCLSVGRVYRAFMTLSRS